MSIENRKIDFYMSLWEMYNRTISLEDFENKILIVLGSEKYAKDLGSIYIPTLKDFFTAHNVELYSTEDDLFLRKKILNTSTNIFVDFLIKRMATLNKVFFDSGNKKDVKVVKEGTVKNFYQMFQSSLDKKEIVEVIKSAIRKSLKLSPKDAVFLVNNKVLVRYFTGSDSGKAKRYNGIPGNEMEIIYKERSEDYYRQISQKVVAHLIENDFNFRKINNVFFHQNFIKTIQKTLVEYLMKDFLQAPSLLPAFTNYVFRIFFDEILMGFIDRIMELIVDENSNIKNFINFYDGKEFYLDENPIKKPTIENSNGLWTFLSIKSVSNDREKAKEIYDKERVELDRVLFLVKKMKESKEKLEKKKAELDSLPNTPVESIEYKNIVLDISIGGKEIARREAIAKELEIKVAPFKKDFEIYEEKIFEIKKALLKTMGGFKL